MILKLERKKDVKSSVFPNILFFINSFLFGIFKNHFLRKYKNWRFFALHK